MHKEVESIYIKKIEKELKDLRKDLANLGSWKNEKKLIENKINAYGSINFNEVGFKSKENTFDIADLLASDASKINLLESKIDFTEYKYNNFKIYIDNLTEDEQKVINYKYLETDGRDVTDAKVAKIIKFSKTHVKRLHESALKELAYNKYQSIETT